MDGVGEVDHGGAAQDVEDVAVGGEHVDLVREQVDLDVLEEFLRIAGVLLHLQQALEPFAGMAGRGRAGLVHPVRGDAGLRHALHVLGADLYLDGAAVGAEQHRVQGLVAVGLGDGDVVLEAPRHGLVDVVHHAQHAVAGVHLVDHDAETVHVGDLVEAEALVAHLVVDAIKVLLAALDGGLDALLPQAFLQRQADLLHHLLAVAARLLEGLGQHAVAHRIVGAEAEVLQLQADVLHAQALGDGGVDLQGLAGDAALLVGAHHAEGAHVVQAIGELDEDHADVLHHGEDHLAEVLRLRLGLAAELDLGQLGDAIDQLGDLFAEFAGQLLLADAGVLNDVVQDGGDEGAGVHAHLGQDPGHRQRMVDVGFARHAHLAIVGLGAVEVGPVDVLDLVGFEVSLEELAQVVNQKHRTPGGMMGLQITGTPEPLPR